MDITESSFESSAVPGGEELLVAGGVGEEFRPAHEGIVCPLAHIH